MSAKRIPAKDWTFKIDDGTETDTFVEIGGIQSFTLNPGGDVDTDDITDFDDESWTKELITRRSGSLTLEGDVKWDPSTNERDAGQESCEDYGREVGLSSVTDFEIDTPMGNTIAGECTVAVDSNDGDDTEMTNWSCTMTFFGKPDFDAI